MPFFDFKCNKCGKEQERMVKTDQVTDQVECEDCEAAGMEKLISAPKRINFKGDGFYETEHGAQQRNK